MQKQALQQQQQQQQHDLFIYTSRMHKISIKKGDILLPFCKRGTTEIGCDLLFRRGSKGQVTHLRLLLPPPPPPPLPTPPPRGGNYSMQMKSVFLKLSTFWFSCRSRCTVCSHVQSHGASRSIQVHHCRHPPSHETIAPASLMNMFASFISACTR